VVVDMTILQATDVRRLFGPICAIDGVSLHISEGEHVSIIGPNGAGKTTLVNVLTGMLTPSAGTVSFKGHDVSRLGPMRLARLGMARSFQLVNIFPQLSVRETLAVAAMSNLGIGGRLHMGLRRNRAIWKIVERVADLFGFSNKLDQTAKNLSQGDKKLLDVASAFALEPEIILLDEPTSGVSTAEKSKIMQVLVHAAKQTNIKAIIQVEHDMDIVFGYSSRIIAVHNGRILADGSPTTIRALTDVMATVVGRL
jgi:branched-chain amino acid transport system ATP-binding protein